MRAARGRCSFEAGVSRYLMGKRLWLPTGLASKRGVRGTINRQAPVLAKALSRAAAQPGQSRLRFLAGARADAFAATVQPAVSNASALAAVAADMAVGVPLAPAGASARGRRADAAEQRAVDAASRGIGNVSHVAGRQAAAAKAGAADASDVFGASVRDRLRRQLAESRAKASASVAAAQPAADALVTSDAVATGGAGLASRSRARPASVLKRRRGTDPVAAAAPSPAEASEHAVALLASFQRVRSPSGVTGVLRPKDVGGGGWCFFNAFYDQLGSRVIPGPTFLAVLALEAMADRQAEFAPFVAESEEVSEARAALGEVPAYHDLGVVDRLTPFQCVVLDKLEGVITGDLFDSRRYADDNDMQVLLGPSGLEALVLESNDVLGAGEACRSRLYPSHQRADAGRAAELLEAGALDLVFVRYELGAYWHYVSVAFDCGSPWRLDGAKRDALEKS